MIPVDTLIVLDTNVLVHLARNDKLGQKIEVAYDLTKRPVRPIISIVTVGGLFAFARKRSWGEGKIDNLKSIIGNLTVVDIRPQAVIDHYAKIAARSEAMGRRMEGMRRASRPTTS